MPPHPEDLALAAEEGPLMLNLALALTLALAEDLLALDEAEDVPSHGFPVVVGPQHPSGVLLRSP